MINSLTYLTRRCQRKCQYCALRDSTNVGKELPGTKWELAFDILKELNVDFNLILGNETWLLGEPVLSSLLKRNKVPYALYTTCPEPLFSYHKTKLFDTILDNLSCGIDYPVKDFLIDVQDDSYYKSIDAWKGFTWVKNHYPEVDTQGTITIHKKNIQYAAQLVQDLTDLGVFIGINFIHWNKDGLYDFFPSKDEISDMVFSKNDYPLVEHYLDDILNIEGSLLQNPEFVSQPVKMLLDMGWHCKGNPYSGPTIDADGHLRCCGYRRGQHTPKLTIFDLPKHLDDWKEAVYKDAMECPGCAWSYPWMFHYWESQDPELGKKVFTKHAGRHIDEKRWSKRKIE